GISLETSMEFGGLLQRLIMAVLSLQRSAYLMSDISWSPVRKTRDKFHIGAQIGPEGPSSGSTPLIWRFLMGIRGSGKGGGLGAEAAFPPSGPEKAAGTPAREGQSASALAPALHPGSLTSGPLRLSVTTGGRGGASRAHCAHLLYKSLALSSLRTVETSDRVSAVGWGLASEGHFNAMGGEPFCPVLWDPLGETPHSGFHLPEHPGRDGWLGGTWGASA
ncbi:hypothetical protein E2I00_012776, partial [Balaenoptera physalus]